MVFVVGGKWCGFYINNMSLGDDTSGLDLLVGDVHFDSWEMVNVLLEYDTLSYTFPVRRSFFTSFL